MASAQCYKTCEQSCQQKNNHHQYHHHQQQQHNSSIGQKITGLFKGNHNDGTQTKTECYSQTEVIYQPAGYAANNQTNQCNQTRLNHAANGTAAAANCHGGKVIYQPAGYAAKNQTNQCDQTRHNHTANGTPTATNCHGGNRRVREHKRNMFQRIKDGVSGHSSDSGSSSDESDSDNENHHNRKHCN